jgi:hypothetical protein
LEEDGAPRIPVSRARDCSIKKTDPFELLAKAARCPHGALLHTALVDDPVEHRVRNPEDAVSTLVRLLRRAQIDHTRFIGEQPRGCIRADLENFSGFRHRVDLLCSAAI